MVNLQIDKQDHTEDDEHAETCHHDGEGEVDDNRRSRLFLSLSDGLQLSGMIILGDTFALAQGCVARKDHESVREHGEEAADDYNMSNDEKVLLGEPLDDVECGKSGKPEAIAREIGKRPVLAFGNSSGDYSMLNYAEGNPDHTGMGFFVVCDDTEREYGSEEKAAEYYSEVEKEDWTPFSMKNDWKTIYGDKVKKTELPGK